MLSLEPVQKLGLLEGLKLRKQKGKSGKPEREKKSKIALML